MKKGLSLKQAWTALILCAVIVPVMAVALWAGKDRYDNQLASAMALERHANEMLRNRVDAEVRRFETLLRNKTDPLVLLLARRNDPGAAHDINGLLQNIIEREPATHGVMILSLQGEVIDAIDPETGIGDGGLPPAGTLREVVRRWGFDRGYEYPEIVIPSLGRMYIGAPKRHGSYMAFSMAVPIGRPARAALVAVIDVERLWAAGGRQDHGPRREATRNYILDRRGSLITALPGSAYRPGDIMTHLPIVRSALIDRGWPVGSVYAGVDDRPVYGAFTTVPSLSWILVSEVPVAVITRPIWLSLARISGLVLPGVLLFAGLALLLAGRMLRPIRLACNAIDHVARGEYDYVLHPCGIHELDAMSAGINDMAQARRRAEQALREREQDLAITLNSIGDAVIVTDDQGRITRMNPVAQRLTGWPLDEAAGEPLDRVFDIIDVSTRQPLPSPVDKVMNTGEVVHLSNHTTLIARDGAEYHITDSAAPIRDEGRIMGVVLVFNDVTEQYRLRQSADRSKRDLQAIMDHSPALIYVMDTRCRFVFVNREFERIFQTGREAVIGAAARDVFPEAYAGQCRLNDEAVLKSGQGLKTEEVLTLDDGEHRYMSVKFPLLDGGGERYAVCSILTDITEWQQAEEALRRAQKMEAIGQLSGGIAHDFNNQLGVVIGYLDFLRNHVANEERPRRWVEAASRATLRCIDLTRQLLAFSRQKGRATAVVDLNALLGELENMVARSVTPAVEVRYFLAGDLWPVEIDAGEFHDVILNLVINARDAMPDGGKLVIETANKWLDEEYAARNPQVEPGDYVQVKVSDTGAGMDRNTLERAFEPFFTTKQEGKGTGLGLAMVYGFVKRYGGHVRLYSEPGMGTTLCLYLPRCRTGEERLEDRGEERDEDLPGGRETVLVVDDEEDLLALAEQHLNDLGYHTLTASDGSRALAVLERDEPVDLLFSDVVMPGGMNGYELARQATRLRPDIKILLTSGFNSRTIRGGQDDAPFDLLEKPYRKASLARRVRQALDEPIGEKKA